ncbi:tetratricopeptide repeat protein [Mucilaginibacter lacusdianchii]|uniref:tetratricopeptide repeat protein n=1 Tax=Mucilaginibacter lacusdianchii TaxID=2684211 RepID=UPI00131C2037|nr:hypothetical protein [Mucilaginibacter sp. JXJ CY 39]
MLKYFLSALTLITFSVTVKAQTADAVYDKYVDFNLARLEGRTEDAFKLGAEVLPVTDKLPAKSQISFSNSMAKLYEDANQLDKALPLYEKVAVAVPDFYVVHRALGYIYVSKANDLAKKLNASAGNKQANTTIAAEYKAMVNKALPHLEKAQACDPSDETLALIKTLFKNTQNTSGLASLNERIAQLSKNCLTILDEN